MSSCSGRWKKRWGKRELSLSSGFVSIRFTKGWKKILGGAPTADVFKGRLLSTKLSTFHFPTLWEGSKLPAHLLVEGALFAAFKAAAVVNRGGVDKCL